MFSSNDNNIYSDAIKDAAINREEKNPNSKMFLMLSLSFLGIASYFGYNYFQQDDISKTSVMGVTYSKTQEKSDIDYAKEIEKLDNPSTDTYSSQLANYVNKEIKKVSPPKKHKNVSKSSTKSKKRWRDIIVVVKKGDTLGTLAKKYYNDSSAYDKIIRNNKELTPKSHTIYPGQKLRISQYY
jgi:LysM repeat protein